MRCKRKYQTSTSRSKSTCFAQFVSSYSILSRSSCRGINSGQKLHLPIDARRNLAQTSGRFDKLLLLVLAAQMLVPSKPTPSGLVPASNSQPIISTWQRLKPKNTNQSQMRLGSGMPAKQWPDATFPTVAQPRPLSLLFASPSICR